eukprot:PhM_4_TR9513/c1_g1_i3/m.98248/K19682/IFT46; intraflagellar transport protein 46
MPPKRDPEDEEEESSEEESTTDDDGTSSSEESSSSSSEEDAEVVNKPTAVVAARPTAAVPHQKTQNMPHDEEFDAGDDEVHRKTPPGGATRGSGGGGEARPVGASAVFNSQKTQNMPHDEEFDAGDDDEHRKTPPGGAGRGRPAAAPTGVVGSPSKSSGGGLKSTSLHNAPHDEAFDVDDDGSSDDVATPPKQGQTQVSAAPAGGQRISNDTHDEAFDVDDAVGHTTTPPKKHTVVGSGGGAHGAERLHNTTHDEAFDAGDDDERRTPTPEEDTRRVAPAASTAQYATQQQMHHHGGDDSTSSEEEDEDDEDDVHGGLSGHHVVGQTTAASTTGVPGATMPTTGTTTAVGISPQYNPNDYANLNVSREVKDLFMSILQFQPTQVELNANLIPFIPELIPAVGDIDAFVRVPRPDSKADLLGLAVVDEPCANQSNPAVVDLHLGHIIKKHIPPSFVDSVEDAHNRPQAIERWIEDIKNVHSKTAPPSVAYTKPMPDIERLMQAWPQEIEDLLSQGALLPPAQLDVDLLQYVKVLCALLDIPTHTSLVESLHVMFTLYMEFKSNQHFQHTKGMM